MRRCHSLIYYSLTPIRWLGLLFLRGLAFVWPRDGHTVVIGGWAGEFYIDNPKYLLEYLLEQTNLRLFWVGKPELLERLPKHPRLRAVRKDSLKAIWRLLNSKFWVCCQAIHVDLTSLPLLGRGVCIDLWHGIPIKYIGFLTPASKIHGKKASLMGRLNMMISQNLKSWLVVSNDTMADILTQGVPARYSASRILRVGTPRNDFLLNNASNHLLIRRLREKYSALFGFDSEKKIVLYLPTWRASGKDVFSFYSQSDAMQEEIAAILMRNDAVLIEKHHWGTYARYPNTGSSKCSIVITASQQYDVNVQELLLISDLLISDYSGAYIDFALLKRPVVHFAYDLEEYQQSDSGMAYDLRDVAAGKIVRDCDSLAQEMDRLLEKPLFNPADGFAQLVEYERGNSCERIARFMLVGQT